MNRSESNSGVAPGSWRVVHESGSVDHLHHLPDPDSGSAVAVRTARIMHPTSAAIVLGSSQKEAVVDVEVASQLELRVARRRSGGGAVLVVPGEQVWVDLLVPRGDPLWHDDIVKAAEWVGRCWADALASLGVDGCEIHSGRLVSTEWSGLVCFAGLGPGEVTAGGAKVMGLSQRRTRDWIKIQSSVHLAWRPEVLLGALALDPRRRNMCLTTLRDRVMVVEASSSSVVDSVLSSLPD